MPSDFLIVDALANMHSHLREGTDVMTSLVRYGVQGGADVILPMPNTKLGLRSVKETLDYQAVLRGVNLEFVPPGYDGTTFVPCMMLCEGTPLDELRRCADAEIFDVKVYPLNRTTQSEYGVRRYAKLLEQVKLCGKLGIRVHFHPEHPWMTVDNRDAEYLFLPLVDMFLNETEADMFWEHGTDARCIPFWEEMAMSSRFFVTLTAHHLATNEDATFGDVRATCKPPIKTERDRKALVDLVSDNYNWVMAGADDAPHDISGKHVHEGKCACGAFTSPFLHGLYAHALCDLLTDAAGVEVYNNFTSRNARAAFRLPSCSRKIRLDRIPFRIPLSYDVGPWTVEPFWAGRTIDYTIAT